jgi:hypothetical protein
MCETRNRRWWEGRRSLGLPVGEYALNGCAIGVPDQAPEVRPLADLGSVSRWLA